jgi:hypothetical protein
MATRQYIRRNAADTQDMQGPTADEVTMPLRGDFTREDVPEIDLGADVMKEGNSWADDMAFNNEVITIRLHETTDPNAEPRVPVCVNGMKSHPIYGNHLPRGTDIQVKRYVAEALLRSKPIHVKTVKTVDHDGNDTAKIVRNIGSLYPFEVVGPKPRDMDWLRAIRAQA